MTTRTFTVSHSVDEGYILYLEEVNWKYKIGELAEVVDYWFSFLPENLYFSWLGQRPTKICLWGHRSGRVTLERISITAEQAYALDFEEY